MVSNQALGAICVEVGLDEYLMFESYELANKIRAYAENLKRKRDAEYELARLEDRAPGQYWIDTAPPKARLYMLVPASQQKKLTFVSGSLGCRRIRDRRHFYFG
jgi:hypothetical protein